MIHLKVDSYFSRTRRFLILFGACIGVELYSYKCSAADVVIPNFWDTQRRVERPNLPSRTTPLRILTAPDHPPFNFINPQGELTGFDVELIRAACQELGLACTIQARGFDSLMPALADGGADAVIAGLAIDASLRQNFNVGQVYLRNAGRFAALRSSALKDADPETLAGRKIGVLASTAHAAYLRNFFRQSEVREFETATTLRQALRSGDIDIVFGDAVSLAFWLNGTDSAGCCAFVGGPYLESHFFGEGYAIVFQKGNEALPRAFNYALEQLASKGTFAELYLRWFPVGLY